MKLIIVKPGIITKSKKAELKKAGYLTIETESPDEVKVIDGFGDLDRDVLLSTAMTALEWGNDSTCRIAFGNLLRKELIKKLTPGNGE